MEVASGLGLRSSSYDPTSRLRLPSSLFELRRDKTTRQVALSFFKSIEYLNSSIDIRHSTFILHFAGVCEGTVTVHVIGYPADIDVDRTGSDTAPASDTLNADIVFVHIIFQLVHEALAHPVQLGAPGIVSGSMHGKQGKHTAVPVAHAQAGFAAIFILDIKTPAGRTGESTGSAIDARK